MNTHIGTVAFLIERVFFLKRSKILSVLLAVIMMLSCLSCLTVVSFAATVAEGAEYDEEGNLVKQFWSFTDDGVLTIFCDVEGTPWAPYAAQIRTVIFKSEVTTISNSAFAGYPVLSNLVFEGVLDSIEAGAFQNCDALTRLALPGTTEIGDYAFYDCDGLTEVALYGGLASGKVGKNIFKSCDSLEVLDIKNGAIEIGEGMFEDCTALKTISLPDSVCKIGRLAFENCGALENIIIPDSTQVVGEYAFYDCVSVKTAYIGHNVNVVGGYAFGNCKSLEDVEIKCAMPAISEGMFYNCSKLKGFSYLPDGIEIIGKNAFKGCTTFDEIALPSTVIEIADSAFDGTALTEINIPSNVEIIGSGVFTNCDSLTDINVDSKNRNFASVDGALYDIELEKLICCPAGKSGTYVVYDGTTELGMDAFIGCKQLSVVEIPDSVTTIAVNAFNGCSEDLVIKANCGSEAAKFAVKRSLKTELSHAGGIEWVTTVEPTCTTTGSREQRCVGCGFVYETEELGVLGHSYDNGTVLTKATCEADGVMKYTCTRTNCGYSYTEAILALGHAMDEGKVTVKPTCEGEGTLVSKCTNEGCNKTEVSAIPALGHAMDNGNVTKEATCDEDGEKVFTCLNGCGKTETEVIPATGHEYIDEVIKNATCVEDGVIRYTCSKCGDAYQETFKGDHICYSEPQKVEPTCDKDGKEGDFCSICHQFVGDVKVLPATGHSFKNGKCTECGKSDGNVKPATPELVKVKNTIRGPILYWDVADNAASYKIYVKVDGSWKYLATVKGNENTSYIYTKAKSGTSYTFTVKAIGANGAASGYDKAGIKVLYLAYPELKSTANTQDGVKLTWSKISGATQYNVYRRTASSSWKRIATVKGTSYVDKTAKSGNGYIYTVRAKNGSTLSSYDANGISIKFVGAPEISKATSTKTGITIKWGKVANADGYIVYRKTAGGSYERVAKVKGNATVSYKDKSAKKGVKYTYVVKAYDGSEKSYKSDPVTITDKY